MTPAQINTDPRVMSTMLDLVDAHRHEWNTAELQEMLRHQLSSPLQLSLGTLSGEVAHQIRQAQPPVPPLITLAELLVAPQPPLEILRLVKRFAKMCRRDRENPLPSEIVMLLYYVSISAALVRVGEAISNLPPTSLKHGLDWLCEQPWLTDEIRALLRDGLDQLRSIETDPEEPADE
jgi:hypothetical protein